MCFLSDEVRKSHCFAKRMILFDLFTSEGRSFLASEGQDFSQRIGKKFSQRIGQDFCAAGLLRLWAKENRQQRDGRSPAGGRGTFVLPEAVTLAASRNS